MLINIFYYFLTFTSFCVICSSFRKYSSGLFLNYFFYMLVLSLFYFILPSYLVLNFGEDTSNLAVSMTAVYMALAYHTIFLIAFSFSLRTCQLYSGVFEFNFNVLDLTKKMSLFIGLMCCCYVIALMAIHLPSFLGNIGSRGAGAEMDRLFMTKYKIYFVSLLSTISMMYLFFTTGKKRFLLLYVPYILYAFLISDRDFIFRFIFLFAIVIGFSKIKINVLWLITTATLMILINYYRGRESVNGFVADYSILLGEFIFTWITTSIIDFSSINLDVLDLVGMSIAKAFPPYLFELIVGSFDSYANYIDSFNPLHFGLSGSLISEVIAYRSIPLIFLTPLLIVFFGFFVNKLYVIRPNSLTLKVAFVLCILFTHSAIRSSFYQYALYPIGVMLSLGLFVIIFDFYNGKYCD
ncbi:hypothetical protein FCV58_15060 [Vibrio sp. F13]|uniref:hypothetical protein n=1 Tax=Vibrio sp. F13 TaxID=2070777 RepID=UPI0010BD8FC8|nr:hypothetical protein [Vibrio sp. F13]TKF64193.1 hypothetical protein FCV58_15060 [Vibrio sp. F13]